jgi:transposase
MCEKITLRSSRWNSLCSPGSVSVRAALVHPWSNGQTEGQITKLKLVKRQMYGRGKRDLLEARLIKAA